MRSLWNEEEARQYTGPLGPRVYSSRLLGREHALVLHGGGNTSVKLTERNLLGDDEELLYVKGSGWDLESIQVQGFTPVRLQAAQRLAMLPALSDPDMVGQLAIHTTRPGAPAPSVETLLHAILPHRYVDHTHTDALLSVCNAPRGEDRIREIYGDRLVVIPYVMPGFDLARLCAQEFPRQAGPQTVGMVLLNHGLFSFGADARESYERMIALVTEAEDYLDARGCWQIRFEPCTPDTVPAVDIARLRADLSAAAGAPMILSVSGSPELLAFSRHPEVARISQQGPATPDHVIRTKRLPMLGREVSRYTKDYADYFARMSPKARGEKTMLDPAPRMVLDPAFGFAAAGRSAKDALIVTQIYEHSVRVFLRAEGLGGWNALPEQDLFDMEYWDLEQAKLKKSGTAPEFQGEVALVTGAASGIGKACVDSLLRRGAAVIGLDLNAGVEGLHARPDFLGVRCDMTDHAALKGALDVAIRRFGGLDMLVLNAGIFPASAPIAELPLKRWEDAMRINAQSPMELMQMCHPLLRLAPRGGRVVVIGSKNVPAPGPGAAAYSASKAALNQLARVAALEWGADGIRVNSLHPNAVYDTGLWTPEVLAARAAAYGVSVEQYRKGNVLKTEVSSNDVAELAAAMCGALFSKTTGAQLPVDGGNERVI